MQVTIQGKVALVTGGTRGIGRAIVERLLAEGCPVAFCGTTKEGVSRAEAQLARSSLPKLAGYHADVSSRADVERLFEAIDRDFGGLDILVNNAGIGVFAPVAELSPEDWDRTIGVNLTGAYLCTHYAIPRFRSRGSGFVINIGSLAGKNPFATGAAYNASKFGLIGLTEAAMLDHRYDNVRTCCILPGSVSTEFRTGGEAAWKIAPEDIAEIVATVLKMPERTMVSQVEVRPSRPKK